MNDLRAPLYQTLNNINSIPFTAFRFTIISGECIGRVKIGAMADFTGLTDVQEIYNWYINYGVASNRYYEYQQQFS